jgi:hypothetical protein
LISSLIFREEKWLDNGYLTAESAVAVPAVARALLGIGRSYPVPHHLVRNPAVDDKHDGGFFMLHNGLMPAFDNALEEFRISLGVHLLLGFVANPGVSFQLFLDVSMQSI